MTLLECFLCMMQLVISACIADCRLCMTKFHIIMCLQDQGTYRLEFTEILWPFKAHFLINYYVEVCGNLTISPSEELAQLCYTLVARKMVQSVNSFNYYVLRKYTKSRA